MKISVIIPNYNGSLLITRCLDSVFGQNGNHNLDVIVIDDGSTDDSIQVINNYPGKIKLIRQKNQGPASARNKGIEIASGNYLAFLDADDYWAPNFLEETVHFLNENPKAVAVSVGQKHLTLNQQETIIPQFLNKELADYKKPFLIENFYAFWAEHNHVCTGSILIRTEIAKKTGGQRIELRITEDLEFWALLATYGSFGFIPSILFISDGVQLTKQIGWFAKNRKRWASAPTVEQWEKRIIKVIQPEFLASYQNARGRIAKNLAYSMIMSSRSWLARKTVQNYGANFPKDKVSAIMRYGSRNFFYWIIVVLIIRLKEYSRILKLL